MAARYLVDKGYYIRERDWRKGHRDIDIVALNPTENILVFVEVKARKAAEAAKPEQAVDRKKVRNMARVTDSYVKQLGFEGEIRFDIVAVTGSDESDVQIEHIQDAFNPLLSL